MFKRRLAELDSFRRPEVSAALSLLSSGDIRFVNCEMPLTRRGQRVEKTVNIRSDPSVAEDLKGLGVDVVTLANNHMLDFSYDGLLDTLETLDGAGIHRVGAGTTLEESLRPVTLEANGARIAFFGIATTLPLGSAAGPDRPGVAPVRVGFSFEVNANLLAEIPGAAPIVHTWTIPSDLEQICECIDRAKGKVDYVAVAVHWGVPAQRMPASQGMICEYQQPLAHALIEAGADAIIGCGSHNLHGVETFRGKPIFYSLGDLIFHRHALKGDAEPESAIVQLDFRPDSVSAGIVPVLLNEDGLPELVAGAELDRIVQIIEARSEQFNTRFERDGDTLRVLQ